MVILDPYGMTFDAVGVFGLAFYLLFRSWSTYCDHKAFYHIVDGYRNYFGQTFFGEIAFNTVIDDSSGFLKKGTSVIDWKQLWNFKASNANKKYFFCYISG